MERSAPHRCAAHPAEALGRERSVGEHAALGTPLARSARRGFPRGSSHATIRAMRSTQRRPNRGVRRASARILAVAVALTALASAVTPAAAVAPKILFGLYPAPRGTQSSQDVLRTYEARVGHILPGIREFKVWDEPFPTSYETWLRDTGHTVYLSVKAARSNGRVVLWRDIANAPVGSALYDEIVGWANAVKGFGAPISFTFNHEPEAAAS